MDRRPTHSPIRCPLRSANHRLRNSVSMTRRTRLRWSRWRRFLRQMRFIRAALRDGDASGTQKTIVNHVAVFQDSSDRPRRIRAIVDLHHRLVEGWIERRAERLDLSNTETL